MNELNRSKSPSGPSNGGMIKTKRLHLDLSFQHFNISVYSGEKSAFNRKKPGPGSYGDPPGDGWMDGWMKEEKEWMTKEKKIHVAPVAADKAEQVSGVRGQ